MANMTREDYIKFQKETVAKSRSIYQKALEYCPKVFTPEIYPDFLNFLVKWNHFSALNVVLLYMQCPKASYLSGFSRWQEIALEQGYDKNHMIIKPDQKKKGITLLIPFSFSNVQTGTGQPVEQRYLTYKSVIVFDVSQINELKVPPYFSPYVPIHKLSFKIFLSILREQFQDKLIFALGNQQISNFQYSIAYLQGNTIYYLDAASDQEKTIAIICEIIRFYVYQVYKDEKERDLVYLSTTYTILHYFQYPTNTFNFSSIAYYQNLSPDKLFRTIHYICTLTGQFIYEFYKVYQSFLSKYTDEESNKILSQLDSEGFSHFNK